MGLSFSGGSLSHDLILNRSPTSGDSSTLAATKAYVDNLCTTNGGSVGTFVQKKLDVFVVNATTNSYTVASVNDSSYNNPIATLPGSSSVLLLGTVANVATATVNVNNGYTIASNTIKVPDSALYKVGMLRTLVGNNNLNGFEVYAVVNSNYNSGYYVCGDITDNGETWRRPSGYTILRLSANDTICFTMFSNGGTSLVRRYDITVEKLANI